MSDAVSTAITVDPVRQVRGRLQVPGDKSISHRYALLAALADGVSTLTGYAPGADCASTLRCLARLGVNLTEVEGEGAGGPTVRVAGRGLGGCQPAREPLDAGNSGTTMRLLAGVLAGHPFESRLTGDASLRRRPMQRVVEPLRQMGAKIDAVGGRPPLTIRGGHLQGVTYAPTVASAQIKSAVLLAGLHASGTTRVRELAATRDHTERALEAFGVAVTRQGLDVEVEGGQTLRPLDVTVPGDPSSAAFWVAAAAIIPDSDVTVTGVGLNPTRTAFLDLLRTAGADLVYTFTGEDAGEPVGTIQTRYQQLQPMILGSAEVPGVIDEIPILAVVAAFHGGIEVDGAGELRAKESDRIRVLADGLRRLGASVETGPDGFRVTPDRLRGGPVDAAGDHRMAMSFAIAALGATGPTTISGYEAVDISYPGFFTTLRALCG